MRLLCIKEGDWHGRLTGIPCPFPSPKYGEQVTAIGETDSGLAYLLAEYVYGKMGFTKRNFIPLSNIDEIEYADKVLEEMFQTV
jgi:hypothetical protein